LDIVQTPHSSRWSAAYVQQHNNAAGVSQAISAFMNSPEYAVHFVITLYEMILDRAPDAAGLQYWTSKMGMPGTPGANSGSADEKAIVAAFFGSDEFYFISGNTPQGWIGALYGDILGRAADGSGAAFWANELSTRGAGDRDGIVRDLLTTPEAAHLVLDSLYPAAGGTSSNPLPVPGAPACTGSTGLATITGDGWKTSTCKDRLTVSRKAMTASSTLWRAARAGTTSSCSCSRPASSTPT
jgi:hypothetical protein